MSAERFRHVAGYPPCPGAAINARTLWLSCRQVTLVTTLLDSQVYTKQHLAEACGLRWTIETGFEHIKTTMNMNVLRCQTVAGAMKELTMFVLVYNLMPMTMCEAARRQSVPIERISFVDALRWLATAQVGDLAARWRGRPCRLGAAVPVLEGLGERSCSPSEL